MCCRASVGCCGQRHRQRDGGTKNTDSSFSRASEKRRDKRGTNVGYDLKMKLRGERRKMEDEQTSKQLLFRDTIDEILV